MRGSLIRGAAILAVVAATTTSAIAASPPEAPTTEPATAVAGTSATLNGKLNPHVKATVGWYFAYSKGSQCTEEATTPLEPEIEVKEQVEHVPVTGLEPSTTYRACLVATHTSEEETLTTVGSTVTFKTTRSAPAVDSEGLTRTSATEADVETAVNPEREDSSCKVEYGTTKGYGLSSPCEPGDLGGGFGDQAAIAHITGLSPGTTYFFRVAATNATGVTKGAGGEFTTASLKAPTVESEQVVSSTGVGAVVEASLNPGHQETTYFVEYATNEALTEAVRVEGGAIPAEPGSQARAVSLGSNLTPGTRYYYRFVAENSSGTSDGEPQSFTTAGLAVVETGEATGISRTTAALTGSLNPEGAETTYRFVYIDRAGYEAAVREGAANPYERGGSSESFTIPAGHVLESVGTVGVKELRPGTIYHYALEAKNEVGTSVGSDTTFATAPGTPPDVGSVGSYNVTPTTADLTGALDPRGLSTSYRFEVGTEAGHLSPEATSTTGSVNSGSEGVAWHLAGLSPETTYHVRLCASNSDGSNCSAETMFTTSASSTLAPVTFTAFPILAAVGPIGIQGGASHKPVQLTRAQKVAKALKSCRRKTKQKRRHTCEKQARKRYAR